MEPSLTINSHKLTTAGQYGNQNFVKDSLLADKLKFEMKQRFSFILNVQSKFLVIIHHFLVVGRQKLST